MRLRIVALWIRGSVLWAAAVMLMLASVGCAGSASRGPGLNRADLEGKPSPDFSLVDQSGRTVGLKDLQGRAVALTFLYSSCPDVCPIVTHTFGEAFDKLGEDRKKALFVIVSVDPERDSVAQVRQFLEAQGLRDKMLFLTGDRPTLESVWAAYHLAVIKQPPPTTTTGGQGFYYVDHHNRVYLIDPAGRQRVLLKDFNFTAEQLIEEMKPLIREAK